MKNQHTKTPWNINIVNSYLINVRKGDEFICTFPPANNAEANARHIVKCVNNHDDIVEMVKDLMAELTNIGDYDTTCIQTMNEAQSLLEELGHTLE